MTHWTNTLTIQQEKKLILKDLGIWKKMTDDEKTIIKTTDNEIQLEQWVRSFITKYL